MPSADWSEICNHFSTRNGELVRKATLASMECHVYGYVRNRYTQFKHLDLSGKKQDAKAISHSHVKVREKIASLGSENNKIAGNQPLKRPRDGNR